MATKKYTVKASANKAVKASFADDLKNAKETYNADFKQGPYAAAKNDGSIGERLDGSSTEGMGMVYLKDKNGNISAVGSEETYDFAKKMVDKFNKQWHDDMADAVWELQHGADDVDGACGKKKSVKSSAKRKPMMNSVKSSKRSVKASSVDGDRPNSAPNSWKSSQRMAYKVTEDQTKGERSFPTSIDDVYKVLGEMQGTWTNPTTGWTGKCEIYERDLDDGSYIFSLIFGDNELEPDDILYDPNGNNYYSNKPKFTIYPHSGAPIFADSIEDFKRKLKKEYSYLKKVGDNVGASMKKQPAKKSVKAARENKYVNEYVLQGNYGQGWEDLVSYDSRQEGNVDLKAYNENEQGVPHRLITRKGNNPNYKAPEDRFRVLQYDGGFKYKVGKTMKFSDLEEAVNYAEGNEKDCVLKDMVTGYSVQIPNDRRYSNYNADRKLKNIEKFYDVVSKSTDSVESSCFKKSVKASSMRKPMRKTIKASSMAKRRASKRVMAAYNGEDLVMYFNGKKVYQGQPGADMYDAVLKLCENDTNRLKFQEWCNQFGDPLFEEGEYGDAGETAYVFCELIYQEFNDGSDGEDGNGILNFEIFPASQEVSGATSVKCAEEAEDKVFTVSLYYDDKFRDLAGSEEFTDLSDAESYAHEYLDEFCVAIEYPDVDTLYINPDIYWDSFDGEFACTPEIAEWQNAVWRSMGIDASTKAVKAGINAPSTDGPLCICENCKAEIESREGRQTVYNVISDLDIEPDEKLVCDWCEDEATELYQISPDEVNGTKKAVKANDGIAPDDYDSVDDMVSEDTMAYDISPDVAVAEIEGVENYLNGFELHLRVSYVEYNTPDDWVVDYNMYEDEVRGAFIDFVWYWDEDLYKEVFYNPDSADYDDILDAQYLQGQFYPNNRQLQLPQVSIDDKQLEGYGFTSEKYAEVYGKLNDLIAKYNDFNNERFTMAQNQMGNFLEVKLPLMYPTLLGGSVEAASSSDDELDPIMGDDFNEEDMGYGYTTNGEAISESMVDELCRIANEILEKSELAKVSSWCDIDRDSFDYWCDGSAYVSEKFTITFTYTAELMTFNKFVKEDAWWKPSAEHGLGFEINVKDGEIESVTYTDKYWAGNSTPLDNAADIFDIEALEAYIGELAAPVAMDIYNGTTNI